MITLERIKNIAEDIIADDEWVNDSHSQAEHSGIKAGLEMLIRHLEEIKDEYTPIPYQTGILGGSISLL